jgi:hypothetical protein
MKNVPEVQAAAVCWCVSHAHPFVDNKNLQRRSTNCAPYPSLVKVRTRFAACVVSSVQLFDSS